MKIEINQKAKQERLDRLVDDIIQVAKDAAEAGDELFEYDTDMTTLELKNIGDFLSQVRKRTEGTVVLREHPFLGKPHLFKITNQQFIKNNDSNIFTQKGYKHNLLKSKQ